MIELGTAQMFVLAALMFFAAGTLTASVLIHPVRGWTERWAPADRHGALAVLALFPPALTAAGLVSVTMPTLLAMVWPAFDHCLSHGGHSHLCFTHGSHHIGDPLGWSVLAVVAAWFSLRLARGGTEVLMAAKAVRALQSAAQLDPVRGYRIVASSIPLCTSVGLIRPRLIISDGLVAQLSDGALEIIIAHEREHERRKDTLVRLAARVSTAFVLPSARRALLAALEVAAEQACDEKAAASTGDRLAVADTILAVERKLGAALGASSNSLAIGFGGSSVAARVHALLEPARMGGSSKALGAALTVLVAVLLGGFEQVHHITESLLGHLGH